MRRLMLAAATGLVAIALTSACGGDEASTPTPEAMATAEATSTPTPTPEPTPVLAWPGVTTATITTDDLNVRTGPGSSYQVVGRLNNGAEVPVAGFGAGGNWIALTGIGWVVNNPGWVKIADESVVPTIASGEGAFEIIGPLHPPGTRIDIPVVDEVVFAVTGGNREAVARLAAPVSDTANVPPAGGCPGAVLPATGLAEQLDAFFTSEVIEGDPGPLHLYAVVGAAGDDKIDPTFVVVFAFEHGEARQVWVAPDGAGVTWFSLGCAPTPPGDMLQPTGRGEPYFWFRPAVQAPVEPVE